MKIIYTLPDVETEAAGPTYSVVRLCESLISHGNDTTLAFVGIDNKSDKPFLRGFPRGLGPSRLGLSPEMLSWLKKQTCNGQVDIIHNHCLWMMPNIYPSWAVKNTKVPYVVSPRGSLSKWAMSSGSKIKRVFWPVLQKPALENATCFHATAISEYHDIRRLGFKQPVAIIPNGVDIPPFNEKPNSIRRTVLYLGRLHPVKGVDLILQAWAKLEKKYTEWDLQISGPDEGSYAEKLKALALKLGIERVKFTGPLYGLEKLAAYRNSDLYLLPSHSENFGMTVAEALASGTPAIVSKGAPWHGLIDNNAGWWIDIGYEPLLACMDEALTLPHQRMVEMGANGRRWMQEDYSWHSIGGQMEETYHWLIHGGTKPAFVLTD